MNSYLTKLQRELTPKKLLRPIVVAAPELRQLANEVVNLFPAAVLTRAGQKDLTGRDVVLIHAGEHGWEELVTTVCRQSPGRLFVVAPRCPSRVAFQLSWVADLVLVEQETLSPELQQLSWSA